MRHEGIEEREARHAASLSSGIKGKLFARNGIRTGVLTVPVEGGSGILKRRGSEPVLSEHGKWRREHIGAINAAYGRTPYHAHLMPDIEAVYAVSEGMTLEEFNSRMLDVALGWLDMPALDSMDCHLAEEMAREVSAKVREDLSIFDALFRLGREVVFALRQ